MVMSEYKVSGYNWLGDGVSVSLDAGPIIDGFLTEFHKSLKIVFEHDLSECFAPHHLEERATYQSCAGVSLITYSEEYGEMFSEQRTMAYSTLLDMAFNFVTEMRECISLYGSVDDAKIKRDNLVAGLEEAADFLKRFQFRDESEE